MHTENDAYYYAFRHLELVPFILTNIFLKTEEVKRKKAKANANSV